MKREERFPSEHPPISYFSITCELSQLNLDLCVGFSETILAHTLRLEEYKDRNLQRPHEFPWTRRNTPCHRSKILVFLWVSLSRIHPRAFFLNQKVLFDSSDRQVRMWFRTLLCPQLFLRFESSQVNEQSIFRGTHFWSSNPREIQGWNFILTNAKLVDPCGRNDHDLQEQCRSLGVVRFDKEFSCIFWVQITWMENIFRTKQDQWAS